MPFNNFQDFDDPHFNPQEFNDATLTSIVLPDSLLQLQDELLDGYALPSPPASLPLALTLSHSQMLSLKHYVAWALSQGTVEAYRLHASVLETATETPILSVHMARKLATDITGLHAVQVDMCPNSCIAYTGSYKDLDNCPFQRERNRICGLPRYSAVTKPTAHPKPCAQMVVLPIMATIRALFANASTSQQLRYRDKCLQQALKCLGQAATGGQAMYSDFANGAVHMHHYTNLNLFQDTRDIAFALSTDGAQLTMKKQSDTWMLLLVLLNLPPEVRYKSGNTIIAFATPGPKAPGDIESFLYPLFQEAAQASEGIWVWDALESSYFVHRAHICMGLGDMLGSAKLSGMAGHTALYGDRFTMVQGARSSTKGGSRYIYYPTHPPGNNRYNPTRPKEYDLDDLPMRTEEQYWKTITALASARNQSTRSSIVKNSGISRLPLCAASKAFLHPTFFPMDPFHIFFVNNVALFWDLWTIHSDKNEHIHVGKEKIAHLGELVASAMITLPPAFCGPIRDPNLKRQSQYKAYEWMALLHWYIVPIGIELGFPPAILQNFASYAQIVEYAMAIQPKSHEDIHTLHDMIKDFIYGMSTSN